MSALAFAILALLLTGPVPALLARARWPYRAPRAAMVLWQAIAVAAVLSAFSSGLAIASRLLVPGPDGHPTATITGEIDRLGWGLWLLYVTVFAITILIGVRLMVSVVRVGYAPGAAAPATAPSLICWITNATARTGAAATTSTAVAITIYAFWKSMSRWPTVCRAYAAGWSSVRGR